MPSDLRNDLMRRMLSLKPMVEDAMSIIEKTMHEDFMINFARNLASDTYPRIADIINKMERGHMEESLKNLSESRPKSAEVLKELLFTFDDIVNLSSKARMIIFDQVPTERIVTALKGTDTNFRELILSSLASRTRRARRARTCDRHSVRTSAKSWRRGGRSPISRSKWPGEGKSSSIRSRRISWYLPKDPLN